MYTGVLRNFELVRAIHGSAKGGADTLLVASGAASRLERDMTMLDG